MHSDQFQVTIEDKVVKFTLHDVPDRPGVAAEIFNALSIAGINVVLVVQSVCVGSTTDISLVVSQSDCESAKQELEKIQSSLPVSSVTINDKIALMTLEKGDLSKIPGTAAKMFKTLASNNINIDMISTNLHSITCLIKKDVAGRAYDILSQEFIQTTIS